MPTYPPDRNLAALLDRFRTRDRLALARLATWLARGERIEEILHALGPASSPARVVGLTGAGGVGKSSLTGRLIEVIRQQEKTVGVLACDPESPLSGGALLGDRFRMAARADDQGVFIRSLAAAGGQGALARHIAALVHLLEAYPFEVVLVETVGAGQGDTVVRALTDVLVLLLQPEAGDDLQWEKAGLLEVADLIVIHKADLPGADRAEAQVLAMLALSPRAAPPVLRVSSRSGEGISELWSHIVRMPLRRGSQREPGELYRAALDWLQARSTQQSRQILERWRNGQLATPEAVRELLREALEGPPGREGPG